MAIILKKICLEIEKNSCSNTLLTFAETIWISNLFESHKNFMLRYGCTPHKLLLGMRQAGHKVYCNRLCH